MNIGDALGSIWTSDIGEYPWGQELIDIINPCLSLARQLTLTDSGLMLLGRFNGLPKNLQQQLLLNPLKNTEVTGTPVYRPPFDLDLTEIENEKTVAVIPVPIPIPIPTPIPVPVPVPVPTSVQTISETPPVAQVSAPTSDFPLGYVKSWRATATVLIVMALVVMGGISAMNVEIESIHVYGQPPDHSNVIVQWIADLFQTLSHDMRKNQEQQEHPGSPESPTNTQPGNGHGNTPGTP